MNDTITFKIICPAGWHPIAELTDHTHTFRLDKPSLQIRIANLEKCGFDTSIERQTLAALEQALAEVQP